MAHQSRWIGKSSARFFRPPKRCPVELAFADAAARIRNRRTAATSANKQTRPDADGLANEQSGVVDQTANDTVFVP